MTVYGKNDKNLFWSIKSSGETILNKLKSEDFLTSLSTHYFSTLYKETLYRDI